jgi:hypothetical protein
MGANCLNNLSTLISFFPSKALISSSTVLKNERISRWHSSSRVPPSPGLGFNSIFEVFYKKEWFGMFLIRRRSNQWSTLSGEDRGNFKRFRFEGLICGCFCLMCKYSAG